MYVNALINIITTDKIGSVYSKICLLPLVSTTVIAMMVPSVLTTLRGSDRIIAAFVSSILSVSKPAYSISVGP